MPRLALIAKVAVPPVGTKVMSGTSKDPEAAVPAPVLRSRLVAISGEVIDPGETRAPSTTTRTLELTESPKSRRSESARVGGIVTDQCWALIERVCPVVAGLVASAVTPNVTW